MTRLQKYLDHCIWMAQSEKAYAWWAAKEYAKNNPEEFAELPSLLTTAMKALQQSNVVQIEDFKNDTLREKS